MRSTKSLQLFFAICLLGTFIFSTLGPPPQGASAQAPDPIVQIDPEINKKFVPVSIPPGGTSRLTVYIYNPNEYALTDVAFTDSLEKLQPGIKIAANPQATTTCGGTVTAVPGGNSLSLSGGSVGPKIASVNGECRVSVYVTSFVSGNLDNEFVPGDLTAAYQPPTGDLITFANSGDTTETLQVADLEAPTVFKSFSPSTIDAGAKATLRIRIKNNDATWPLNAVSLTDTLPDGVKIADPVSISTSTGCGAEATTTAVAGGTTIALNNALIPANADCYVDVTVTAANEGSYTNTIPANALTSYERETNPNSPSATLTVNGVKIGKSFSPTSFLAGEENSTLTILISNPYPEVLTGATLADVLPGSDLVFEPGSFSTTCQTSETPAGLVLSNNNQTLTLSNGTIPAGVIAGGSVAPGTCTITARVTAPGNAAGGLNTNTLPADSLVTDQEISNVNPAVANVTVKPQSIDVDKSFSPARFELGGETEAVIVLTNPTSVAVTNVTLTDVLPVGLVPVTPAVVNTTCGGTVTVDTVTNAFTLTGGTIPANGSCSFRVRVTTSASATAGSFTNTIPANAITGAGITNQSPDSGNVAVYPPGLGVRATKTFADNNRPQPTGTSIRIALQFRAPEDETLTNVSVTDSLPLGLTILSSPVPSLSNCGSGSLSVASDQRSITLSGATIAAGQYCYVYFNVVGELPGSYTNTVDPDDFTSNEGQTFPSPVSDTLNLSDFRIQKSFTHTKINQGGRSTLTITLINENALPMVSVWLQDRLSTMGSGEFTIAADPSPTTTCGGTLTAVAGTNIITLNNGVIPGKTNGANGTCTISVTVLAGATANTSTNTILRSDSTAVLTGTTTPVPPRANATATISVANMKLDMVKSFDPSSVSGGGISRMTILLINPNNVSLSEISFEDLMPDGMKVAIPATIDTSTCGGEVTLAPDRKSFSYSGGTLAAGRRCTISLNATIRVNGNRVNTIGSGAVTTFEGVSNPDPASSTLTNLPGVSVKKSFSPNRIKADPNAYSVLTIHFTNTSNAPVEGLGIIDHFPAGLLIKEVAGEPPVNTCGGTLTTTAGASSLEVSGGWLAGANDPEFPGLDECYISVPVWSENIGSYRNVIEEGKVTADDENVTNPDPAEDTLEVYGTPDMQIIKSVISSGPYLAGDVIDYTIVVTNTGDIRLDNVQVLDLGDDVTLGTCAPILGSSLDPEDEMVCSASHVVSDADVLAGEYINSATAESEQTDPVSDDETVILSVGPAMSVKKTVTSFGPYGLGDTVNYAITVTNTGTIPLTDLQIVEETVGVTLGTCTPALGSSLAVGEQLSCAASYQVTQADVDAGSFVNTATASSDETPDQSDFVSVKVSQFPALAVYKYETSSGPYALNQQITYDIVTKNMGDTTLTGVTVIDTGTELPLGPCKINENPQVTSLPAVLEIGDILYCEAYHRVTQADLDLGEYINTAFADSTETNPGSGTAKVPLVQIPLIEVVKTGLLDDGVILPAGQVNNGDKITYTFIVTNLGNVTLSDISIADAVAGVTVLGGPILTLAPGESDSTTFTAEYSLIQADVDRGEFTNTAKVTAYDPKKAKVTDEDSDTKTWSVSSSITLEKTGTIQQDVVAPDDRVDVGDQITYAFTVTNTGNTTLTGVTITDDDLTVDGGPVTLLPNEVDSTTFTTTYTLTQADIDAGAFANTATVTGTTPNNSTVTEDDTDTQPLTAAPGIELVKLGKVNMDVVEPNDRVDVGDTISYRFEVTNTGNVTLTNITISDPDVTIISGTIASLAPGETDSTSITASRTLTQADINAGEIVNTATVTGTAPDNTSVVDTDQLTKTLEPAPNMTFKKDGTLDDSVVPPTGVVNPGDVITYTFTFTNTGNVTLTNLTVTDLIDITGSPQSISLEPGESNALISGTYELTQADIDAGTFLNTATGTATTPGGDEIEEESTEEVPLTANPGIELTKTGAIVDTIVPPAGEVNAGDEIHYTFRVENTGNVTLHNVTITDGNPDVLLSGCIIGELTVGAVDDTSCTGVYTLTQEDVDSGSVSNTAVVNAVDPQDSPVEDEDDDVQTLPAAGELSVTKTVSSAPATVKPGVWRVTYAITVKNTGNVTLSGISVEDDLQAVFPSPHQFSVIDVLSDDFVLNWPGYDGIPSPGGDAELLSAGMNALAVGESGKLEILVEFIPANNGPFKNVATAIGLDPKDDPVEEDSEDSEPPIDFGPKLFNLPTGSKTYTNAGTPLLDWKVVWINSTNIVPIYARMSDPIPTGTKYVSDGPLSGYPLPTGDLPKGTTTAGVTCLPNGLPGNSLTTTTYCYYEGPTLLYPRGRVVWEGTLGPDFGAKSAEEAKNEIQIAFSTRMSSGTLKTKNIASLAVDLDGDGKISRGEEDLVAVSKSWEAPILPQTGFTPGIRTRLPKQPLHLQYAPSAMTLEIPTLGVSTEIVTVPFENGGWDVTWLGNHAGYLAGSAYPTWVGNTVITAHNTTPFDQAGVFADLKTLSYGDKVLIRAYGRTYTYEVRAREMVLDRNFSPVFEVEAYDWVTLMTCDGFNPARGTYAFRQIVRAVLVSVE